MKLQQTKNYLLLIDEEAEIKAGSYYITNLGNIYKETERPFEEDEGVERFGNRSLYKPIIAYYPLNSEAKKLDLPLLPNPFREVDVEELSEKANGYAYYGKPLGEKYLAFKEGFIEGYKAASKRQFSLEDMKKAIEMARLMSDDVEDAFDTESISGLTELCTYGLRDTYSEEEIIQSISTQQLPSEFIPEYDLMNEGYNKPEDYPYQECKVLKTIINSEGKQELVGTYKY